MELNNPHSMKISKVKFKDGKIEKKETFAQWSKLKNIMWVNNLVPSENHCTKKNL
jgi:hypothetical protein